jgi:CxxC-x17-CxxC domain-containing protein
MANFEKRDFKGGRDRGFESRDRGEGRKSYGDKKSFGDRKSYGDKKSFGGDWNKNRDTEVTMHNAVCGECNNKCEVPFRPSQDKPVFCRDCFSNKREGAADRNPNKRGYVERDRNESRSISMPIQSQNTTNLNSGVNEDVKRKLESMSVKIDNLTFLVEKLSEKVNYKNTEIKESETKTLEIKKTEVKPVTKKSAVKVEIKKVSVKAPVKSVTEVKSADKKVIVKAVVKAPIAKAVAKKVVAKKAEVKAPTKTVTKVVVKKVASKK